MKTLRPAARAAAGAASGLAATLVMDAVGTAFWERGMGRAAQTQERKVEPKFPLEVLAERIAKDLHLPSDEWAPLISNAMHWGIGAVCGALHGLLENTVPIERAGAQPVAMGMLAVDEFGFSAAGLAPWPKSFPWQTHARATIAHVTYGITLAAVYESLKGGIVMRNGIFDWFIDLLQDLPVFDSVAHAVQPVVKDAILGSPNGPEIKKALHGTWLGHALHPVLTDFPIGAWTMAAFFDAISSDDRAYARTAADMCVAIGVASAVPTALTGLNDWSELSGRPARVGVAHAACNIVATTLYAGSLISRRMNRGLGVQLAYCGFGVMMLGGLLGGHLVFAQQIGVNRSAAQELPTDFIPVMPEAELAPNEPKKAMLEEKELVLIKRDGRIFALLAACSHLGGPLDKGKLADGGIRCPWHGSVFSLEDGRVLNSPATIAQTCFETRVRDGQIEVRASNPELP